MSAERPTQSAWVHPLQAYKRHQRRRAKKLLKAMPRRANIERYPVLKWWAGAAKKRPFLWSYKRPHMTRAFYLGGIVTCMPLMGLQLLLSLAVAIIFRANLTVTAALQLVSNPLTGGPMYYGTYKLGELMLGAMGVVPEGWFSGATMYLAVGGVAAGLMLGLVLDVGSRIATVRRERMLRRLAAQWVPG